MTRCAVESSELEMLRRNKYSYFYNNTCRYASCSFPLQWYTCIHHRIQLAVGDMTMRGWTPTISLIHPSTTLPRTIIATNNNEQTPCRFFVSTWRRHGAHTSAHVWCDFMLLVLFTAMCAYTILHPGHTKAYKSNCVQPDESWWPIRLKSSLFNSSQLLFIK